MGVNRKYCIYRHLKPNGEVFYIGIGSIKRPYEKKGRNNLWFKTVNKYTNYEIQILKKDLSLEDAKELEIILINYYGRKCDKSGTLTNITLGGEGAFGLKHSDESKLKMSKSLKGRIISEETKLKLSIIRKGKKQSKTWIENRSNSLKNKKLTKEHCKKLSDAKNGKNLSLEERLILKIKQSQINNKQVINTVTKQIFNSIKDAALFINMKPTTLNAKLTGQNKNNTDYLYLKDYKNYE